ncbi:MAG: aminotransferase class I/II-fold pyridoxal phosphate-dependent enzyme [Flavonifractor plautii]
MLTARARFGGDVLDCSANLNPLGMPPAVQAAAAAAAAGSARYPDPCAARLRAAIAARDGVAPEQVLCGGGAAELIFRLAYALRPRRALVTAPAFSEYEEALTAAGCAVTRHPCAGRTALTWTAGCWTPSRREVELVFLCTPNNPTGRLVDGALLRAAAEQCRAVGAVLVVDECFLLLSDGGWAGAGPCLAEYPNLLLLRAFTKSYAMAGLRLGYALSANGGLAGADGCRRPALERLQPRPGGGAGRPGAVPRLAGEGPGPAGVGAPRPVGRPDAPWGWTVSCPDRPTTCCSGAPGAADLKERLLDAGRAHPLLRQLRRVWEATITGCACGTRENEPAAASAAMKEVL